MRFHGIVVLHGSAVALIDGYGRLSEGRVDIACAHIPTAGLRFPGSRVILSQLDVVIVLHIGDLDEARRVAGPLGGGRDDSAEVLAAESDLSRAQDREFAVIGARQLGCVVGGEHVHHPLGCFRRGDIDVRCASAGDPRLQGVEVERIGQGVFVGVGGASTHLVGSVEAHLMGADGRGREQVTHECPPWSTPAGLPTLR